jgi:hypothetical protein
MNVNYRALAPRSSVSSLLGGTNLPKTFAAAVLLLVDQSLNLKPGGPLTETPDHFDLLQTTTTGTLYTRLTLCNLIGTNRAI